MDFIKMHGAGNDYVFCDGFVSEMPQNPSELSVRVSDRRFGIGSDGLVLMVPPERHSHDLNQPLDSSPDVLMRMWNADGSEGTMCGNAARCVAFWMKRTGRVSNECRILIGQTLILADVSQTDSTQPQADAVSLTLPAPTYSGALQLPNISQSQLFSPTLVEGLQQSLLICHQVECGNQHAVIFVNSLSDELVRTLGPMVEHHTAFPNRTNVEFVRVQNRQELEVRVWERGSGETLACGSGACAASVAAISEGKCDVAVPISVCLPGGVLEVTWLKAARADDSERPTESGMLLTGSVCLEFTGAWVGKLL